MDITALTNGHTKSTPTTFLNDATPDTDMQDSISPCHDASPAASHGLSSPEAFTTRKRKSLEPENEWLRKRALTSTIVLTNNCRIMIESVARITESLAVFKAKTTQFKARLGDILPPTNIPSADPDPAIHLEHLVRYLGHMEAIAADCSSNSACLNAFFSPMHIWENFFDRLERASLPPTFWADKAARFLSQITPSDFPNEMVVMAHDAWHLNEKYAEHFCRLSQESKARFIERWRLGIVGRDLSNQQAYLGTLHLVEACRQEAGYDERPINAWAAEHDASMSMGRPDDEHNEELISIDKENIDPS